MPDICFVIWRDKRYLKNIWLNCLLLIRSKTIEDRKHLNDVEFKFHKFRNRSQPVDVCNLIISAGVY